MNLKPMVGDTVHFFERTRPGRANAAIVTDVVSETCVNLVVFAAGAKEEIGTRGLPSSTHLAFNVEFFVPGMVEPQPEGAPADAKPTLRETPATYWRWKSRAKD